MNNRWINLILLLFAFASTAMAAPRTRQQAKAIAERIAREHQISFTDLAPSKAPRKAAGTVQSDESYYVFNYPQNQGFAIVAGDDAMPEVVGYTTQGTFDVDNIPDGLMYYLEKYEATVAAVAAGDKDATDNVNQLKARRKAGAFTPIAPLIKTKWDQGTPYNNLCPVYNGKDRSVTGCVATAMAQLVYYYHTPGQGLTKTIPAYTTAKNKLYQASVAPTTYAWDKMKLTYTSGGYNTDEGNAVAKLMYHCGMAAEMDYGASSSSNIDKAREALVNYFNADSHSVVLQRNEYSLDQWIELIDRELNASRAVYLSGRTYAGGGHSFICDGRDNKGYYHINWGWGGASDGYFDITVLNPDDQGIGGNSNKSGYGSGVYMIIGLASAGSISEDLVESSGYSVYWNLTPTITITNGSRSSVSGKFSGTYNARINNFQNVDDNRKVALAYYDGTSYTVISDYQQITLNGGGYGTTRDFSFNYAFPIGTFELLLVQSKDGVNWKPLSNSSQYPFQVTSTSTALKIFSGSTLTATLSTSSMKTNADGTITFNYSNKTSVEYNNKCVVYIGTASTLNESTDQYYVENVCVPSHGTKQMTITYIPEKTGTHYIWVKDADGNVLINGQTFNVAYNAPMKLSVKDAYVLNKKPSKVTATLKYDSETLTAQVDEVNDNELTVCYVIHNEGGDGKVTLGLFVGYNDISTPFYGWGDFKIAGYGDTTISFNVEANKGDFVNCTLYKNKLDITDLPTKFVTSKYIFSPSNFVAASIGGLKMKDANNDDVVDIKDVTAISNALIKKGTCNEKAADLNSDGKMDITDLVLLIKQLLK